MLAYGTTVILRQLQEKYIANMKHTLFPLVDLKKALDQVLSDVV